MRLSVVLCLILGLIPVTGCGTPKGDKEAIQGTWLAVDAQHEGSYDNDPVDAKLKLVFSGDKISFRAADNGKEMSGEGAYQLDPSRSPKEISLPFPVADRMEKHLGVYALEGDTLTLCFADEGGKARPTEVISKAGSKTRHVVFKRQ